MNNTADFRMINCFFDRFESALIADIRCDRVSGIDRKQLPFDVRR
ncbi:hypothetical protein ABIA50_003821 [Bacillus subtilis]